MYTDLESATMRKANDLLIISRIEAFGEGRRSSPVAIKTRRENGLYHPVGVKEPLTAFSVDQHQSLLHLYLRLFFLFSAPRLPSRFKCSSLSLQLTLII